MPYAIRKRDSKFVVINKNTGKVKSTHPSRTKALNHMRLLYHVEAGGKLTRTKKK